MRIQMNLFDFEGVYPGLVEVYDIYDDILLQKGSVAKAESYYEDALALATASFGENHPSTAEAYNSLGEYSLYCADYREAIGEFEAAIEIRKNILGYQNARTARYLYNLAAAQRACGEQQEAMEPVSEAKQLCTALSISGETGVLVDKLYGELAG